MRTTPSTHSAERAAGALLVGGDWALAHGDADGLAHVARDLAARLGGEAGRELVSLARLCHESFEDAAGRWAKLRRRLGWVVAHRA